MIHTPWYNICKVQYDKMVPWKIVYSLNFDGIPKIVAGGSIDSENVSMLDVQFFVFFQVRENIISIFQRPYNKKEERSAQFCVK